MVEHRGCQFAWIRKWTTIRMILNRTTRAEEGRRISTDSSCQLLYTIIFCLYSHTYICVSRDIIANITQCLLCFFVDRVCPQMFVVGCHPSLFLWPILGKSRTNKRVTSMVRTSPCVNEHLLPNDHCVRQFINSTIPLITLEKDNMKIPYTCWYVLYRCYNHI